MLNNKTNNKNTDKTAEVAPYMITKKEDVPENASKNSILIPVVLVLVLAVIIVSSFFKDEYKELVANLSAMTENFAVSETSLSSDESDITVDTAIKQPAGVTTGNATEVATISSPATVGSTTASTQTASQPGLITVYNPYLRPYPQVYAPIYQQATPYGYPAPYGRPPQQAMSHEEMMQRRQNMIDGMIRERSAAIQRMEKDHRDWQLMMEQRHAEVQKARAEMQKKTQEVQALHEI